MKKFLYLILAFAFFIVGVGIFYSSKRGVTSQNAIVALSQNDSASAAANASLVAMGQYERMYTNTTFHFSLAYPKNLQVQEYKEQDGGFTVTFEDIEADQQFQVYVTPYSDAQISEAQFKLDEPSGVRKNQTDVVVDGARGTMFFSNYPRMDDTREVWFINRGFLYEVTTYKELDSWLAQIMQTWKFI